MSFLKVSKSNPTVVVGLDFGTTFSGFAYALRSKPEECCLFYEWPGLKAAHASNYCKTQTSLLYSAGQSSSSDWYTIQGWGHEALVKYAQCRLSLGTKPNWFFDGKSNSSESDQMAENNHFITRFKLHLAGNKETSAADLPNGLTVRRTISDYLRNMGGLIISELQNGLGDHITLEDIQWCITVPAIWDEDAKYEMKTCAEIAGLVQGRHCNEVDASPHPLIIVLEPEAASFYCQQKSNFPLNAGEKLLVVDAGGGTVDLALHEKCGPPWSTKVREVAPASGGLCGGTYVDEGFFKFLSQKIRCFRKFSERQLQTVLKVQSDWDAIKCGFDGSNQFNYVLDLPAKLARAWEEDEALSKAGLNAVSSHDTITLTNEDMRSIFDPVVDQILELINQNLIPDLKAMMVVGGFSASPYLIKRIKAAFSERLAPGTIIFPKEPGSAICCGAVAFGVGGSDLVMSRISKRTYGIRSTSLFCPGDPENFKILKENGDAYCDNAFKVFTRRGEHVLVDCCVTHTLGPFYNHQTGTRISMFSTSDTDPKYVTDPGAREEGTFLVNHPSKNELGKKPQIKVSMYFGRTTIEMKAVGENFGEGEHFVMPPVTFERSFERL